MNNILENSKKYFVRLQDYPWCTTYLERRFVLQGQSTVETTSGYVTYTKANDGSSWLNPFVV